MGNSVRDVCYEGTNLLQFKTHMPWRVIGHGTINSQQLEEVSSDVIFLEVLCPAANFAISRSNVNPSYLVLDFKCYWSHLTSWVKCKDCRLESLVP
jgi:hypothetical protein